MAYVFDTNSFSVLGNYYPEQFPTFWETLDRAVAVGKIISVKEVRTELDFYGRHPHLSDWVKKHVQIFSSPRPAEIQFVKAIFSIPHFQTLLSEKDRLAGHLCADPFVIAKAKFIDGCVITEEKLKRLTRRKSRTFVSVLGLIAQTFKGSWKERVGRSSFDR